LWWGDVLGDALTDARIAEIDERKEAAYRQVLREQKPVMPGAAALIDALHADGFKLAVGSSGPPANVALSLELLERQAKFAAKVTGLDVTRGKPDPQVFLLAAQRLGVEPSRCAVIEDAPAGIAAANAAGMASIALLGTADAAALAAARKTVSSLSELSPAAIRDCIARSEK
jgi:beta-phosphoglucomutase